MPGKPAEGDEADETPPRLAGRSLAKRGGGGRGYAATVRAVKSKVARGVAFGILSGLAAAAVVEATRPLGGNAAVIDWDAVRRYARRRLKDESPFPAERPVAGLLCSRGRAFFA